MTEQEIIKYLKDNKDDGKGVPLGNMPEEVREWIGRKFKSLEDILIMTHDMNWCPINEFLNFPFALSDDYELSEKELSSKEMTEQEIIDYLKKNKSEGRIIAFMPDEVKRWCEEHRKELLVWQSHRWYKFDADDICTDDAVTLPDDYPYPKQEKGEWDEYDIKEGLFYEETRGIFFAWHEWSKCMSDNPRFTAFGGWQYADSNTWFMTPKLKIIIANSISYKDSDAVGNYCTTPSAVECKPAIPVKIRFWKGE